MRVASYNICHGRYAGGDMALLAADIRRAGADLVGLQEVDVGTARVGGRDTLRLLAEAADMPYYAFCPSMAFDGGLYGNAVLSRYPLCGVTTAVYEARGAGEPRSYLRAEVSLDGLSFAFYNTHCELEDTTVRRAQMAELAARLRGEGAFILTGDFNENDLSAFTVFPGRAINREEARMATFFSSGLAIDNILYSGHFTPTAYEMQTGGHSDHHLLSATFVF